MYTKTYQLKYTDEAEAVSDLQAKGVINDYNNWTDITESVVWDIKVPDQPATYDDKGEVLTEATFISGYHVDLLLYQDVDFGTNETKPNSPSHTFRQTL